MKRRIDFPQDVSKVLRISAKDLEDKDKYPHFCPDPCCDALSSKRFGDWQNDDELVPSLQLTSDQQQVQALADIDGIKAQQKIILVLESPHIDEFYLRRCSTLKDCKCFINPLPAPASGRTGENTKHYLPHIFNTTIFNEYKVAIINPIQYQCSLGQPTSSKESKKNEAFFKLLSLENFAYGANFKKRIKNAYNPSTDLIVCCCTDGNAKYENSKLVISLINKVLSEIKGQKKFPLLKIGHPCSWNMGCSYRKIWIMKSEQATISRPDCFFCYKDYQRLYKQFNLNAVISQCANCNASQQE